MSTEILHGDVRARVQWIDAARALCVLAVVVMHTTISLLVVVEHTQVDVVWRQVVDAMTPFRMPALSLLSGMLLARRIRAGWSDRSVRASAALSYWIYVVWLLVFLLIAVGVGWSMWLGPLGAGTPYQGARAFVDQLILPTSVLWYVMALAIWTVVLAAVHKVSPAAVLIVLGTISVMSFYLPGDGGDQYRNVLRYFVFFAVGVYAASRFRGEVSHRPVRAAGIAVAVFTGVAFIAKFGVDGNVGNILTVPRDISGAVIVMVLALALTKVPGLGRALAWTGRRTLPIYVMHVPLLELLTMFPTWWLGALDNGIVHALAPVAITLAITAASVGTHALVVRTPARVVFMLPEAWRRRILREGR
ncbi:hypothetical protein GCM10010915_09720 [Microbacterium faecale]|uniref:Acyltransferase 3 domain-containing protein n=1 Tax=Microbacterium faecale TaxID=1804630 RepID=A0A916Y5B7_9MICO|nr:acyltransferase [Microbacterium faecale]GGD31468.1 hypothetical protein GCM10010915_09720 [Microbacterium faecale]